MAFIAPGVDAILKICAALVLFILGTTSVNTLVVSRMGYTIHSALFILGSLLSIPIVLAVRIQVDRWRLKRAANAHGARLPPQPLQGWFGNLPVFMKIAKKMTTGYPGDGLDEVIAMGGPMVNFRVLWMDSIFTTSPDHIKSMLATDFHNFEKGKVFQAKMHPLLGTGVFNSDGDMWKFHRSLTRPMFTRDRISHYDLFDKHASHAISLMKDRLRQGYAVDFNDLMLRFTLDTATSFLLGSCVDTLHSSLPYPPRGPAPPSPSRASPNPHHQAESADDFARALQEAQTASLVRLRRGIIWPFFEFWEDQIVKHMNVVYKFIDPVVQKGFERQRAMKETNGEEVKDRDLPDDATLLDHLLCETQDPMIIRDEVINIMVAGRDTTASTLTFIVYLLAQHPHVFARLREEVLQKVGPNRRPGYDDIRDMKYLRSVINETLRLYPIVPFNVRFTINPQIWPADNPNETPYYIPGGVETSFSVFMMHRRKDLWGPDAEEFDPDRFLDDRLKKYLSKNPFIFLPFNAGPRICLGQQFAYNEMSFMIVRLMQSFSEIELDMASAGLDAQPPVEWRTEGSGRKKVEEIYPQVHLTLYSKGGLWVKMKESDN